MYSFVVLLCSALVLLHGANCHRSPQPLAALRGLLEHYANDVYKRGLLDGQKCVDETLEENGIDLKCEASADEELELDFTSLEDSQPAIDSAFSVFCEPECGNAVLDAMIECKVFKEETGIFDLFIGLCGTNVNGERCYEHFISAMIHIQTEAICFANYSTRGVCECEAELSQEVADQGCCLDTFHEFITTAVNLPYDPRELYDECGVDIPGGCSNSPVSISSPVSIGSSVAMVSTLTTTTALIVSVVLALD